MPTVELRTAYEWTCDACGRDNFCRAVTVEMSEEDRADLQERYGGDDWATGEWVAQPTEVTCGHCGATYETEATDVVD